MLYPLDALYRIQKLSDAISSLIELSKTYQSETIESHLHVGSIRWLKECCTVKICGPRRSGHTLAICHILLTDCTKAIIIGQDEVHRKTIKNMLKKHDLGGKAFVRSIKSSKFLEGPVDIIDAIIVDRASELDDAERDQIYNLAIPFAEACRLSDIPFVLVFLQ